MLTVLVAAAELRIAQQNRTFVRCAMHSDVKTVKPLSGYRLYVEMEDGRRGFFDMTPYLDHGVFRELKDVGYFNRVAVVLGAVTWPHQQDIALETRLAEMIPVPNQAA